MRTKGAVFFFLLFLLQRAYAEDINSPSAANEVEWYEPNIVSRNDDELETETVIELIGRVPENFDLRLDPRGAVLIDAQKKVTKVPMKTIFASLEKEQESDRIEFTFKLKLQPGLYQVPFVLQQPDKKKRLLRLSLFVDADKVNAVGAMLKKRELKRHQISLGVFYQTLNYNINISSQESDLGFSYKYLGAVYGAYTSRSVEGSSWQHSSMIQAVKPTGTSSISVPSNRSYLLMIEAAYRMVLSKGIEYGGGLRFQQLALLQRQPEEANSALVKGVNTLVLTPQMSYSLELKRWRWKTSLKYLFYLPFGEASPKNDLSYEIFTKFGKRNKSGNFYGLNLGVSQTQIKVRVPDTLTGQSLDGEQRQNQIFAGLIYEKNW